MPDASHWRARRGPRTPPTSPRLVRRTGKVIARPRVAAMRLLRVVAGGVGGSSRVWRVIGRLRRARRTRRICARVALRSEEHTSELQSLMRNSYAVFCLKKKKTSKTHIKISAPTTQPKHYYSVYYIKNTKIKKT